MTKNRLKSSKNNWPKKPKQLYLDTKNYCGCKTLCNHTNIGNLYDSFILADIIRKINIGRFGDVCHLKSSINLHICNFFFRCSYHPKYFKLSYAINIQVIKVRCKQKIQIYSEYKHKETIQNQANDL